MSSPSPATRPTPPRLLDLLRMQVRYMHYSLRTEQAYVHWVRAFIRFNGLRHPAELSGAEVEAFLTWLAAERQVAPATHKQALSALLFLYQKVLNQRVPWMDDIGRPQRQAIQRPQRQHALDRRLRIRARRTAPAALIACRIAIMVRTGTRAERRMRRPDCRSARSTSATSSPVRSGLQPPRPT